MRWLPEAGDHQLLVVLAFVLLRAWRECGHHWLLLLLLLLLPKLLWGAGTWPSPCCA